MAPIRTWYYQDTECCCNPDAHYPLFNLPPPFGILLPARYHLPLHILFWWVTWCVLRWAYRRRQLLRQIWSMRLELIVFYAELFTLLVTERRFPVLVVRR